MIEQMKPTIIRLAGLLLAVAAIAPAAHAQWSAGIGLGASRNTLHTESGYAYDRHYASAWAPAFGVSVRYDFTGWFGLQSGVSVLLKNYGIERSGTYARNRYKCTNTFLDVPVMARFSFGGERLRGYVLAGGYMGAWLRSHVSGRQIGVYDHVIDYGGQKVDETVKFDSRRDNRFDAGLCGGAGVEYGFGGRLTVFVESRYYYGLTDLQKGYMGRRMPRYNNTLTLSAGIFYSFGK